MEEFLYNYYSQLTKSIILVAVVAGLISYNKYKGTTATFFIKILVLLLFIEIIGSYAVLYERFEFLKTIYYSIFRKNYWWYTISFDLGIITLFSIFYQKIIKTDRFKLILKYATYLFLIFAIAYLAINGNKMFHQAFPILQIFGALIILLCCVFYALELLLSDKILNFYKSLYFYISIGIFLWWMIITPLSFYDLYFINEDWSFIFLQWQIYLFANFFMYLIFTIGLIVSKPETLNKK